MSFQWPSLLWLLFLAPVLVAVYLWAQRRKQKYAVRYASLLVVKDALGRGPGWRRHIPAVLFLLGLIVMTFGLARPQASVVLPSNRGTVILALDISGSMRARDILPSRIEAAKEAAREFIAKQPRNVRIGIVAFSATSALVQPPTTTRGDMLAAIDRLRLQRGTAIGAGILTSLDAIFEDAKNNPNGSADQGAGQNGGAQTSPDQPLSPVSQDPAAPDPVAPGSYTSAVVVLLTDGQSNTGPDPLEAANQAANRGVRIFTVGIGSVRGDIVGVEGRSFRVGLDENGLKKIAQITAAQYFRAENERDLVGIYRTLSSRLMVEKDMTEITALVAAAAMVVLLAAGMLSLLWFNRPI
jgi:Ca-activated chloride channel homolog